MVSPKKTRRGRSKKNTTGRCFFFCCGPARTLTHSLRAWVVPPPRRDGVFFFAAAPPGPGWCFFFAVAPPRRSLTHCGLGRFRQGSGGVYFFCCGPAGSFLVSLKRPGGAAAKKNTTGRCFFFAAATRGRSLTHCGPGWCLPLAGVVFFFLLRPRPDRGGVFFCCGPAQTLTHSLWAGAISARFGWCFFFLLWPRPVFLGNSKKCLVYYIGSKKTRRATTTKKTPRGGVFFFAAAPRGRSLTHCGPGWCLPLAGVVFFFLLRPRPDRGGVFFFAVAPPRRSFTHCGLGRFRQGSGGVFFFCCGPAGSFLVSLKRPGGAAAKKTPRGGVFFFAAAPRGRSLTHCGPGWCLPLAGVVFFFCCGPARTGVVFFFCCGPAQTLTHSLWAGAISARFGWCFFFCCGPARSF